MSSVQPLTEAEARQHPPRKRPALSTLILLGLLGGILAGIFFGEYVAFLDVVGNGFIRLLQMTILPYITASLIVGIGSLTLDKARTLAIRAGILLLVTWVIAFGFILLMPLGFPHWESASFFSSSLVEFPPPPNFLELYIPANPFHSLAANLIPAVVLFSIAVGVAMIGMGAKKQTFLQDLSTLCEALMRITGFVVRLTPLGVFAIAASAAGTMTLSELSKLQVYLILFNLGALLLTFWVLPAMVAVATPFRYREVVTISRDALLTAFTTGNLFVVLPVLTENAKTLFAERRLATKDTDSYVDVIIPVSFNFPNIGKLIMLFFILFAAWFSGNELDLAAYPQFIGAGLMSFFGGVDVALPFMLNLMRFPTDLYQLYVVTGIVNGRTATLLAAMNLLVFTLLVVSSLSGRLRVRWARAAAALAISLVLLVGSMLLARLYFEKAVDNAYDKDEVIANMQLAESHAPAQIYDRFPKLKRDPIPQMPLMQRIRKRKALRVGYMLDKLPYSYVNDQGQLVGLDIEMAYRLAKDLEVQLVLAPVKPAEIATRLTRNDIDIVMAGVAITASKLQEMLFSAPYMDVRAAFAVPDNLREAFKTWDDIRQRKGLRIAVVRTTADEYILNRVKAAFPDAHLVYLDATEDFFTSAGKRADALLVSAEAGSAWTLLYPSFTIMVPGPRTVSLPLAYPVAGHDERFADLVSRWIDLKKKDGDFQRFYDHWILGISATPETPRWSVIRNLLHWVK